MGKHAKKPFVDHKNATKYRLLHREHRDVTSDEDESSDGNDEFVLHPLSEHERSGALTMKLPKHQTSNRNIDDHFDAFYEEQYADERIDEDGEGNELDEADSEQMDHLGSHRPNLIERFPRELPDAELKKSVLRYVEEAERREQENGAVRELTEKIYVPVEKAKRERWDCESIVSTHSNLYNHPTEIREIQIGKRKSTNITGGKGLHMLESMEVDGSDEERETVVAHSVRTRVSMVSSVRPKDETAEERRIRKSAVKEERRERRREKKRNKEAFREERLRMEAQRRTAQPKAKLIH